MIGGMFDPFQRFDSMGSIMPTASIHIGIVKSYTSATKTCMVTVPVVSGEEPIGPMQVMQPLVNQYHAPSVGDTVIVAFLDGEFNNAVVLGKIAY